MNRYYPWFIYALLFLPKTALNAQKPVKDFGPGFCDSIHEISKAWYDLHQVNAGVIDTANIPPKKGNRFSVKFGKDSLVYQDLADTADQGVYVSDILGIDKKRNWTLVRSSDEITDYFYLIDHNNLTVHKLVGYPYVYGNYLVCIEEIHTDMPAYVEVWQIKSSGLQLIFKDQFSRCEKGYPDKFAITPNHEFMFTTAEKYWLVIEPLF